MAGGEGTRLRPLTMNQPKPMLPMANRPLAGHVVALLREHGIEEIVVTVAYLANTIRTYFGDGSEFGVRIIYATEETPLGTAGSVLNAREELDERFLVISGDVLTDIDLGALVRHHDECGSLATLALKSMENPLEFGIVITDDAGRIERFLEKPTWGQVFSDTINTGIYVLEPEVLDRVPSGRAVDFASEVFPALLEQGAPVHGYVSECYWEDVGTLEAYLRAHEDVLDSKVHVELDAFPMRPGVFIGEGAEVDPSAVIDGPALIGDNCRIGAGVRLGPYSVLGSNVRVGEGTDIERSVIHDNCYLGAGVNARASVIGRSCEVRNGVHLEPGVVLGDGCRLGGHAVVLSGVKIYPNKVVEAAATVTSSIIWESRGSRSLFGRLGVTGLANVDLSPELAVRVAMAFASALPKGATVTTSRDSSRAARMLKRAAMVGLNAAGLNVEDLEAATVPVTRFQVRNGNSRGGITVRLDPDDPQSVLLRFLDAEGNDLDEAAQRKIERLYYREESRRVLAAEIGDIGFAPRTAELYTAALFEGVDLEAIRSARYKLVLDYAYGTASLVMPTVLGKLGAEVLVVNPLVSTPGVLSFDRSVHAARLADLVRSSGAHLGAVISPDGERMTLVDDTGHMLSDAEALLVFAELVARSVPGAQLLATVDAPSALTGMCARHGASVTLMGLAASEIAAARGVADFAGDSDGGFAFPDFLPAHDAVAALVRLLDLLAPQGRSLARLTGEVPVASVVRREVHTPFEQKGTVMRTILESGRDADLVLVDGVKRIDASGWTLVVPDQDRPVTHVYAEGRDITESNARADVAAAEIRAILAES